MVTPSAVGSVCSVVDVVVVVDPVPGGNGPTNGLYGRESGLVVSQVLAIRRIGNRNQ